MSGGSLRHSRISTRLTSSLDAALRNTKCTVVNSDLRVRASSGGPFFYPDAAVFCGPPELADEWADTLLNPTAIFEVTSPSTEAYDRGAKFAKYRGIASLREYVLVSQSEPLIELFTRQADGKWLLSEFAGRDAVCKLDSIGCDLPLASIYDDQAV